MAKSDTVAIQEAVERLLGGDKIKDVLADTGLHYSPVWLAWRKAVLTAEAPELFVTAEVKASPAALALEIADLRDKPQPHPGQADQQCSWGEIAVRCQMPESRVRKLYTENTTLRSQGLRKGKGGRWFADFQGFYENELVKPGTEIPKGMTIEVAKEIAPTVDQEAQRELLNLTHKELVALAKDYGIKVPGRSTTFQVARLIRLERKAQAQAPAKPKAKKAPAKKAAAPKAEAPATVTEPKAPEGEEG